MIKNALEYLVGLGNAKTFKENGQTFAVSNGDISLLKEPTPAAINVSTLSSLVKYVQSEFDDVFNFIVHIVNPTTVRLLAKTNNDKKRDVWVEANALLPDIDYGKQYDLESFNILLQSNFLENDDKKHLLKVVGNVKEEDVNTYGDDGMTQTVTAKSGVANVSQVIVPNPVELAPYRTFVDVPQPESDFVFRMRKGHSGPTCALFESDGGAWRLEAITNIKRYFEDYLAEEIAEERIHILA